MGIVIALFIGILEMEIHPFIMVAI